MQTDEDHYDPIEYNQDNIAYAPDMENEISAKEQIILLIAALKETAAQELSYIKARANYSIGMASRGIAAIILAIIFVLVAFISMGVGLLLILEPIMGIILSTLLTVVIFLLLSIAMTYISRFYFKKLSFPELSDDKTENENKHPNQR